MFLKIAQRVVLSFNKNYRNSSLASTRTCAWIALCKGNRCLVLWCFCPRISLRISSLQIVRKKGDGCVWCYRWLRGTTGRGTYGWVQRLYQKVPYKGPLIESYNCRMAWASFPRWSWYPQIAMDWWVFSIHGKEGRKRCQPDIKWFSKFNSILLRL